MLAETLAKAKEEHVLIPAFIPLSEYGKLDWLQARSGRRVMEAVTPCGVAGQRLVEAMAKGASEAGAELWPGRRAVSIGMDGGKANSVVLSGGLESMEMDIDSLLIATGGPITDGLLISEKELKDPFGLFSIDRGDDILRGGYAVRNGRLLLHSGRKAINVFAAGDCISSVDRRHGHGISEALDGAWNAVKAMEEG